MKTFKVRVTGAKRKEFWYAGKIGEIFEVTKYDKADYYAARGGTARIGGWLLKSDCVIVEDFKVGDRVRVDEGLGRGKGSATITSVAREYDFIVHHDDGDDWAYNKDELTLLEDAMEYTKDGVTYRQLKDITPYKIIMAGAPENEVKQICKIWDWFDSISLENIINNASSCNEKLQWLVDQGFVEVVEEVVVDRNFIDINLAPRMGENFRGKSIWLSTDYSWALKRDEIGALCLVPKRK